MLREKDCDSLDSTDDGEHNGVVVVGGSKIFVTQGTLFSSIE